MHRVRFLLHFHADLCNRLGIFRCIVKVIELPAKNVGMYYPHLREIHLDPWLLKRKNRQLLIQTIAHETYHHYQYERGVFTWLSGPEYYKGLPVEKIEMTVPHSKRPWERAANRYGNKILKMYNNGELKWLKTRKTVSGA